MFPSYKITTSLSSSTSSASFSASPNGTVFTFEFAAFPCELPTFDSCVLQIWDWFIEFKLSSTSCQTHLPVLLQPKACIGSMALWGGKLWACIILSSFAFAFAFSFWTIGPGAFGIFWGVGTGVTILFVWVLPALNSAVKNWRNSEEPYPDVDGADIVDPNVPIPSPESAQSTPPGLPLTQTSPTGAMSEGPGAELAHLVQQPGSDAGAMSKGPEVEPAHMVQQSGSDAVGFLQYENSVSIRVPPTAYVGV